MKVLSLYDGMSCGQIAFRELGIPVEEYHAYEIDKYAIKVSEHNFPEMHSHGDVMVEDYRKYQGYDWLVGGSPCTYWSIAQSPDKRETTSSGIGWELFSHYVRALHEAMPKMFLYENNKSMSKEIRKAITETFGFEPYEINSALVSAQNRQRLYWVGILQPDGTYHRAKIPMPKDRGILLKDVLDDAVAFREKSYTLDSNYFKTVGQDIFTSQSGRRAMAAEPVELSEREMDYMVRDHQDRRWNFTNKPGEKDKSESCYKDDIRNLVGNDYDRKTCVAYAVECDETGKPNKAIRRDGKIYTVYEVADGRITVKGKQYPIKLRDGYYIIRKLTVTECKRLQTVPDWYDMSVISPTQAYKCLGNGWTVEVIMHLISGAMKNEIEALQTYRKDEKP